MIITGKVITGLGQGKQFMSMPEYKQQFQEKLGFTPFEGTLNIEIEKELILGKPFTVISGFTKGEKEFGSIGCFNGKLNKTPVIIISPEKSQHMPNIIEVIAKQELRKSLHLKDGDEVEIEVLL